MGNLTAWSAAFFLATIAFAVATVASAIALGELRDASAKASADIPPSVTAALLIATAYLTSWGIIGLRT